MQQFCAMSQYLFEVEDAMCLMYGLCSHCYQGHRHTGVTGFHFNSTGFYFEGVAGFHLNYHPGRDTRVTQDCTLIYKHAY
jgi:hypothetical protein